MNFSSNCSNNNNNNNNNGNNNNNDNLNNSIALFNTEYFINDYTTPSISELNKFEAILNSLNISNAASDRDPTRFTLPIWRQILWSFFYAAMILVGTGGNLIVIWIVLAHKRMRTVTNYFLLNLSIADTMSSTLNVTFNYVYMLYSHWPFGETYCKITQFIAAISVCASVFSLMSISIDRYMAIMTPLKPRMGRFVTLVLAILTWVFGILIGTPSLLYFRTHMEVYANGERRIVCYPNWPDADAENNHSVMDFYFNILFLIITYIIPIFSMSYTYTKVGLELWGSQSIGEVTQRQMENIKSKRRVVKMMMVVVIMFAVCWLPYQLYFIAISCYPEINNTEYIQETFLGIYWLAMSNSMYNPIIYCWMNARFRRGFKQVFASWVPFMKKKPSTTLTRRQVLTSKRRSGSVSPDRNRGVVVAKNTGSGGTPTLRVSYNPNKSIQGAGTDPAPVTAAICNPSTSSNQIRLSSLSHNNQHHHHQRDSTASSSTTINNTSTFCFIHHHHPPPLLSQAEEKEDDIMMIRRCDDGIVRCDAERLNLS